MNLPLNQAEVFKELKKLSPLSYEFIKGFGRTSLNAEIGYSVVSNSNQIKGIWIYRKVRKLGFTSIEPFPFLPHSILFLSYPDFKKPQKKHSFEVEVVNQLLKNLPSYDNLTISLPILWKDHLPFLLNKLPQTTKYTYRLDLSQEIDTLWERLDSNRRRHIKTAKKEGYIIENSWDLEMLYGIKNETHDKLMLSKSDFVQLFGPLIENKTCEILSLKNESGQTSSAIMLAHDNDTSYYIVGGSIPNKTTSSSFSLLIWEAIKHAQERSTTFDFEGSVIPDIERFFRSFGGELTPYHVIQHTPSKIVDGYRSIKRLF